ncbi:glycerol-3-phosphate cytidylyltransferase [Xylanibacter ruminicola]|uniref:adenylyltransferase/cytidyltransferase family protein n=1 Tax=Xylanibacter ruminicola TaxID=839 RepID=UPI0008E34D2D|nr:adenylyltransferase/cytidyltransferase family protein [Xylanibacter ruminicola]SFC56256.1 glycerol-3-phosphate cytidylyltransferase [Xylanibacter ruminicola]
MKKILTVGVFDMLHLGHVALFKKLFDYMLNIYGGGYVVVAVQDNNYILKYKPDSKIVYSLDEKIFMLESIKYINEVVIYKNVDEDIKTFDFDIFAVGPDQNHAGFQKAIQWCHENGREVVVMPRTEGISSTQLKDQYIK